MSLAEGWTTLRMESESLFLLVANGLTFPRLPVGFLQLHRVSQLCSCLFLQGSQRRSSPAQPFAWTARLLSLALPRLPLPPSS